VKWFTLVEATKLNNKEPKKILVEIYTEYCMECKMMYKTSFTDSIISDYLNKNYYPVRLDALSKDTILYNGNTYINEGETHPFHNLAVALLNGKMSFPSMVLINNGNELISVVPGYFTPKNLEPVLHFFSEEAYKTKTWEEYLKDFSSSFK
jgi:thioredoxin-related protein